MKKDIFFFYTLVLICTSCTFSYDREYMEDIMAKYNTTDTITKKTASDSDSIVVQDIRNQNQKEVLELYGDTARYNVLNVTNIKSRVIITDDDTMDDIETLKVTVRKVRIDISVDDETQVIWPEVNETVKEPMEYTGWLCLPDGLKKSNKDVCSEAISFSFLNNYEVRISIFYTVRVRDGHLAQGCSESLEYKTVKLSSSNEWRKNVSVNIPIELTSVQFDAVTDDYGK